MTLLAPELSFAEQTAILRTRAAVLRSIALSSPSITVDDLLEAGATECRITPSQMMYALSFADVKGIVSIDYDSKTVTALRR